MLNCIRLKYQLAKKLAIKSLIVYNAIIKMMITHAIKSNPCYLIPLSMVEENILSRKI